MNQKEIKELIDYLIEKDIAEFELERGDVKLRIKRAGGEPQSTVERGSVPGTPVLVPSLRAAPAVPQPPQASAAASVASGGSETDPGASSAAATQADRHTMRSPIVGTFYEAASPGAPAFVKVGDRVEAGQVLCVIEAMKLMNEIEAEVSGEIVARHVNNAQPVEY
ncbi:MAG TPA: acetyl-CoA carboxylase biotin carboxyl carrier protein, partial [Terriglobales bacterium]|nr:acetyl-CoA carboxylase biotin carboxyl carrier protein [Terriglobales bacterium]